MRSIVLAVAILCAFFSSAEARRGHGRLPWCGIYMNQYFGKSDRSLWIARNWAREGSNAGGPSVGVVVVWPHHVGVIVGQAPDGEWLVHSGNDGNAVRTRPRSLRGVIAYRSIGAGNSTYANLKWQEQAARGRNKHLVALAVEGGHQPYVRVPLKQSRARARLATETAVAVPWGTMALTTPADTAREVWPKQRKPMMKRQRVLLALLAPVPDPVMTERGEVAGVKSGHSSPRIQRDQLGADHPSSRASLRLHVHTPRASLSSGSGGRGHGGGAGAG